MNIKQHAKIGIEPYNSNKLKYSELYSTEGWIKVNINKPIAKDKNNNRGAIVQINIISEQEKLQLQLIL